MIEAACTACGNIHRVSESEIPAGAKFLTCTSCKARVQLPAGVAGTAGAAPTTSPTMPLPSAARLPRAGTGGTGASRVPSAFELDLLPVEDGVVDLPAPKGALPPRISALPSRQGITDLPAPKGGRNTPVPDLGRAQPITDLPAPKAKSRPPVVARGPTQSGPVSRPPPRPLLDLPAPKQSRIGELPPSPLGGLGDLPAPKRITSEQPVTPGELLPPRMESEPPIGKSITARRLADLGPSRTGPADLPAPRTRSVDRAAPDASGAKASGAVDLPAPKYAPRSAGGLDTSGARPRSSPALAIPKLEEGPDGSAPQQVGGPDLPAPRQAIAELPMSKPGGLLDLPAPKQAVGTKQPVEPPSHRQAGIADLPAPRQAGIADLPAPRHAMGVADLPAPRQTGGPDLPAPKHAAAPDLPAPKAGAANLPAPKHASAPPPTPKPPPTPRQGGAPPPMPKQGVANLPTPKGVANLPTPKAELPAPKGFFDDLPQPAAAHPSGGDLPAPLGFFDDLPQPAAATTAMAPAPSHATDPTELPAPLGFFDDLPGRTNPNKPETAEPPAPLGFFDDLPGRPNATKPQPAEPPAPKGFFDDLPGRTNPNKPEPAEPPAPLGFFDDLPGRTNPNKPETAEPPAPLGFFDDLPGRPNATKPQPAEPPAPLGFFDDLPRRADPKASAATAHASPATATAEGFFDDLSEPGRAFPSQQIPTVVGRGPSAQISASRPSASTPMATADLELDDPQSLELGAPEGGRFEDRFDDISRRPATNASGATPRSMQALSSSSPVSGPVVHALDETRKGTPSSKPKTAPRAAPSAADLAAMRARRTRKVRLAVAAVIAVAGLGAGGIFLYRRHARQEEQHAAISDHLRSARGAFTAKDSKRWTRAAAAATKVLELEPKQPAATGLAAEALLADALAYGVNAQGKAARARGLLAAALAEGITGPEIERAQALSGATARVPDTQRLQKLSEAAPQDLALALYLGWSHAIRGAADAAARSFTLAITSDPLKVPALLGRGQARLVLGDLSGAGSDFAAVLEIERDNIAAQVGLAAARPAAQAQQQEEELLAILQRKDLASGDPRAALQAWVLSAEAARRAGRIEPARERYRKAQALAPQDASVLAGLAEIEILDGKLDSAVELADKALALDAAHIRAQLAAADAAIRQKRLEDATAKLQQLRDRKPPLPMRDQARLGLLAGKLFEAQGQDEQAVEVYADMAKVIGDLDLTPALAAVTKLGALAEAATAAKDLDRAAELRARADQLIAGFAGKAKQDPSLALALGVAFLQSNDAVKAEPWLRLVVEARPTSADARFQLARALALLDRTDDAITELQNARKLDSSRDEIGIELARIYEATDRATAAGEIYETLIAAKDPGLETRSAAGRFFARHGKLAKAGEQGALIHTADPTHPAGLYLKAEGALAAGKIEEAGRLFRAAVDGDRDPQYLDGQGRAAEAHAAQSGDLKYQDLALRAYGAAALSQPTLFNAQLGQGRIYVARRDASKAIPPLLMASRIEPQNPEVASLIGLAYKELSEKRVAVEWLARAYRLQPRAETAWHLGQLHNELNSPRDAIAALTNATRLGIEQEKQTGTQVPWLTEALYRLGRIHMDSSREKYAKAAWEKYVARNPKPGAQLEEVRRELATTLQRY